MRYPCQMFNIVINHAWGGDCRMDEPRSKDELSGIYKDLAEVISFESVVIIYENFKGQQVTFPTKLVSKDYTIQQILLEYNGNNIKELVKKHGYSERWVRQVINKEKNKV